MPVEIADQWNVKREGIKKTDSGDQYFTGKIVVTFYLNNKYQTHFTGETKKVLVDQNYAGKVEKVQEKNEEGKKVTNLYKTIYQHEIWLDSVSKSSSGFKGWMFKLKQDVTVVIPEARSETIDQEVVQEVADGSKEKPKSKVVQVKTQPLELLEKLFLVHESEVKPQTKNSSGDDLLKKIMSGKRLGH